MKPKRTRHATGYGRTRGHQLKSGTRDRAEFQQGWLEEVYLACTVWLNKRGLNDEFDWTMHRFNFRR